jgi:hypothetical protein
MGGIALRLRSIYPIWLCGKITKDDVLMYCEAIVWPAVDAVQKIDERLKD